MRFIPAVILTAMLCSCVALQRPVKPTVTNEQAANGDGSKNINSQRQVTNEAWPIVIAALGVPGLLCTGWIVWAIRSNSYLSQKPKWLDLASKIAGAPPQPPVS